MTNISSFLFFFLILCNLVLAGWVYWVASDESSVGCELEHYWRTNEGTILGEAKHIHWENSFSQRCYTKQLVSKSHLYFSPQFLPLAYKPHSQRRSNKSYISTCVVSFFTPFLFFLFTRKVAIRVHYKGRLSSKFQCCICFFLVSLILFLCSLCSPLQRGERAV